MLIPNIAGMTPDQSENQTIPNSLLKKLTADIRLDHFQSFSLHLQLSQILSHTLATSIFSGRGYARVVTGAVCVCASNAGRA